MSFNRTIYDNCAYNKQLNENMDILRYNLDPNKFYNADQKRIDFGVVGGNNISQSPNNLVDLESDLRNQTRLYSRCPCKKFNPSCDITSCGKNTGIPCEACQQQFIHMPTTTLIDYKPRYNNVGYDLTTIGCPPSNPTYWGYDPKKEKEKTKEKKTGFWGFNLPFLKTK